MSDPESTADEATSAMPPSTLTVIVPSPPSQTDIKPDLQDKNPSCYPDVLPDDPAPSGPKRPCSGSITRQQPKRTKAASTTDSDATPVLKWWTGWTVNSCVDLEFQPDLAPLRADTDDGSHDRPPHKRTLHTVPTTRDAADRPTTTLLVERVITSKAAVLTTRDGASRFVGKTFGLDRDAPEWFDNEITAYAACAPLQGAEIPYLLGVAKVVQTSPFTVLILITELVSPSTTVAELMYDAHYRFGTTDAEELAQLARLYESGVAAVEAMHACRVIHNDLAGRNLVLCGEGARERLVLVDFDCAMVFALGDHRWESRVRMDRVILAGAFVPRMM